jgi:lactaldehyde dehydrogenase/glycolaldehyde dehydrogenase
MVDEAVAKGARVLTGGQTDGRPGFFYPATVLVDVRHEMKIMRDETFAPVAPIQTFENLDEAIARANDSDYGLTSSIYTSDLGTALKAVDELAFGETYINRENFEAIQGFHAGWRQSGIGGADGKHGVLEFTQTRLVYLQQ